MNDRKHGEFIDQEMDRLITEADGDGWLALRLSIVERLSLGDLVSSGFCRLHPLRKPRPAKEQIPAIDIPNPASAEAANPSA